MYFFLNASRKQLEMCEANISSFLSYSLFSAQGLMGSARHSHDLLKSSEVEHSEKRGSTRDRYTREEFADDNPIHIHKLMSGIV